MTQKISAPVRACCESANAVVAGSATAARPSLIDGRFELVDHSGRAVTERSFGDRYLLVFFGFTHCAVVCPRELGKLSAALARLGPLASRIQPLYITVDPERDDPAAMRAYVGRYTGGFTGLTGTPEQVKAAKKSFRAFAEPVADASAPGGYVVPHTAISYLMAPGGRYLTHLSEALDVDSVVERLQHQIV